MPMLAISAPSQGSISNTIPGDIYTFRPSQSSFASSFYTSAGHPFLVDVDTTKASMIKYRGRVYGVGGFACQWVFDEYNRVYRSGIPAPIIPPQVSTTAGAVTCIPYYSYYDSKTNERGPLSAAGASFTWNNAANRAWANLPTEVHDESATIGGQTVANATTTIVTTGACPITLLNVGDKLALSSAPTVYATITAVNGPGATITVDAALGNGTTQTMLVKSRGRVDYVELWLSVDGNDVRFVTRRQIGATTATEAVPTLSLGEVAPEDFTRFPDCQFSAVYRDRQVLAGNPKNPDTVYLSELFFPERYGGLFFRTRNGETITGLVSTKDILLIFTKNSTYRLSGYTVDDFELTMEDTEIGAISHFAVTVIYGDVWVVDTKGVFKWNGAYQPMMREVQAFFRKDYGANRLVYEDGYVYHDPNDYTFNFVTLRDATQMPNFVPIVLVGSGKTFIWSGSYRDTTPELAGTYAQASWAFDVMDRSLRSAGTLSEPGGKRTDVFGGFCDGVVRIKDPDNSNDSNDDYNKELMIQTGHLFYGDPGGSVDDGKTLTELWTYCENEYSQFVIWAIGGEENSWLQVKNVSDTTPRSIQVGSFQGDGAWKDTRAATAASDVTYVYLPRTVHYHQPEKVVGRGFTFIIRINSPLRLEFRGLGGKYTIGPEFTGRSQISPG